jgi:hypothetical protein
MTKPNFLIVGAVKSGTTSLFEYLRGHPEVFMPSIKEASYFAGDGGRSEADYLALFRQAGSARAVGEASGSYLYPSNTPAAIHDLLGPDARIVIILRNPVDMAYALWGHMVQESREDLSFFDALAAEESRLADPEFHRVVRAWSAWPFNFAYADRARYARQVAAYFRTFKKSQVHVLIFEEFFADVGTSFAELCRFLDVSPDYRPVFQIFNESKVVRSERLRRLLVEPSTGKDAFKAVTTARFRSRLRALLTSLNNKPQKLPSLSSAERERLWELFANDVAELEELLGRPIDCWGPTARKSQATALRESELQVSEAHRRASLGSSRDSVEVRMRHFVAQPVGDDSGE